MPAGRYARLVHRGHPGGLAAATADLLAWGADRGLRWDRSVEVDGEHWGCRLEIYHTDPREVPVDEWVTEFAFRLADTPT